MFAGVIKTRLLAKKMARRTIKNMGCEICCSYLNFISTEGLKSYHVQPLAIIRKVFQGVNGHNNASSYALAAEQDVTAQRAVIAIREAKGDISFATQNVRTFSAASVH
ncbi:hypothetical protein [Yersinia proxima]|uniref:hypothetical protein n=1 Tax=Yersinia proxima TaxID=2890316 RepID=UPI001D12033C|nr:hypothetical protein [Yersinia proxima]